MKCLSIVFFIYLSLNSIAAIEISSKIDFDSEDATSSDSSDDKSDPVVIVVENTNTDDHKENTGFQSSAARPRAGGNVGFVRGPVKPIRSHSNYPLNRQPTRPKVTKNIYIIISDKTAGKPENFNCRENVCEATLSTDTDGQGNVIGSVHLTVVTKTEDSKVADVPVVDGVRGTGYDNRKPTFVFNNDRAFPNPPFLDNNIPQTPVHRPNPMPRRRPFRPQPASFYPRNFGPRKEFPVWTPWVPNRGSVDDKIEAPLSQTNPSDQ